MPARNVVALREIVPEYQNEKELWQKLFQHCMAHQPAIQFGAEKDNYNIASAFYHDPDYKEVDVEVQMSVIGKYTSNEELTFKTIPELEVVSVTFNGPYEQIADVTETIALWCESNQVKLEGPMFNIYHVSPAQDPNPDNWITEACFCLKKISS